MESEQPYDALFTIIIPVAILALILKAMSDFALSKLSDYRRLVQFLKKVFHLNTFYYIDVIEYPEDCSCNITEMDLPEMRKGSQYQTSSGFRTKEESPSHTLG
jgi:hypothetical protein